MGDNTNTGPIGVSQVPARQYSAKTNFSLGLPSIDNQFDFSLTGFHLAYLKTDTTVYYGLPAIIIHRFSFNFCYSIT